MKITEKLLLSIGGIKVKSSDGISIGFDFDGEERGYHFVQEDDGWSINRFYADGWECEATVKNFEEVISWLLKVAVGIGETKKMRQIQDVLGIR